LTKNNNHIGDIVRTVDRIEKQISEHYLLSKLNGASDKTINNLKKQYGEDPVCIGEEIVNAYTCLNEIVLRLKETNQQIV